MPTLGCSPSNAITQASRGVSIERAPHSDLIWPTIALPDQDNPDPTMALDPTLEYFIPLPELDTTLNIEPGAYHQIEHDIRRVDALLPNSEAVSNEAIGAHGALCTTPRQDSGENTGPSQAQRTNLIPMERFLSACSVVDDPSLWRYHCSGLVRRPSPYTVPGRPSQSSECGEETSAPSTIHPTITKTDGTESASQVSSAPTSND